MKLSRLASSIQGSVTLAINAMANRMRVAGEPVIHLGGGEPESKCPESAVEAGGALLRSGEVRYGPEDGTPALKAAVCEYTREWYGVQPTPENVCVSAGTKQALMVCLQSILDPGDEVVIFAPYWASYSEMVRCCAGEPKVLAPAGMDLQPSLDALAAAVSPKTRAVILNSPNNPSGVVYQRNFVAEVVQFAEKRGLWLIADDIYQRLLFDGQKPLSLYEFSKRPLSDTQLVVLNGVSKAYAMTGFRIGWGIANPQLRKAMGSLQGQQTSGPCTLSQEAARAALKGPQGSIDQLVRHLEHNRDLMAKGLEGLPRARYAKPTGAFYCFPDFSAYEADSARLAQLLLERVKVVTVPGAAFGMEGHLRLSTCGSSRGVQEGLARIAWALDANGASQIEIGGTHFRRNW